MADEKKYSAREAALAILAKAQELLAKSDLIKADYSHDSGIKGVHASGPRKGVSHAGLMERQKDLPEAKADTFGHKGAVKAHTRKLNEIKDMPKPDLPKSEEMNKADSDYTNEGWSKTIDHGHAKHDELASHAKQHGAHGSNFSTWVGGHQSEHNFKNKSDAQGFQHSIKRRPEVKKTKLTSYNGGSLHSVRATLAHGPHEYKKMDKSEDVPFEFEEMKKSAEFTSGFHTVEYFEPMGKSDNPDAKQDEELGEQVEGLCERHMSENKDAERKEGHKVVKSELCKMCKGGQDLEKSEGHIFITHNHIDSEGKRHGVRVKAGAHALVHHIEKYKNGKWHPHTEAHGTSDQAIGEAKKMIGKIKEMHKSDFDELYEDLAKMEKYESENPNKENEIGTKFGKADEKGVHAPVHRGSGTAQNALSTRAHGAASTGTIMDHHQKLKELKEMPKPKLTKAENKDAPSNPMKPKVKEEQAPQREAKNFETQPGKASAPADARQAETPTAQPPQDGVAEKNMNPQPGSVPGKGVHKLSYFMGHRHNKRNGNKPPVS